MIDAINGDVYVDEEGKLWRVIYTCPEPTLCMEELEPHPQPNPVLLHQAMQNCQTPLTLPLPPRRKKEGGVSGQIWNGFKRVYRKQT